MTTFADLGVPDDIVAALAARNITAPFPIQALTIPDARAGRDVCGKAKTGSGKTLAFGLPTIENAPAAESKAPGAVILAPTRELASQIGDELAPLAQSRSVSVGLCYGGAPVKPQVAALEAGVDVLVATPGRLIDLYQRGDVKLDAVKILVLDEADRMADMGFTPQVEWLMRHMNKVGRQTMLFSATLDGDVAHLISRHLTDPVHHGLDEPAPTVSTMTHRFLLVHQMDKPAVAGAIAKGGEKVLIFTRTKRMADVLTRDLKDMGVKVDAIHGDRHQSARERALEDFTTGKRPVLVATDVAARGLDIQGVDRVIHYDPAEDHKAYLHRSGRTARAGQSGLAVTLVLWNEELQVRRMLKTLHLADHPIVEVFSNDQRLTHLEDWVPEAGNDVAKGRVAN